MGVIVVGGASFYAGSAYQKGTGAPTQSDTAGRQFGSGQNGAGGMRNRNRMGGFITGDIIAKDAISITVKLSDGGSKIVFFTPKTSLTKNVSASLQDLTVGERVAVNGAANPDGSINAQSIQTGAEQRFRQATTSPQ